MTKPKSKKPAADTIIRDLHRIREAMVDGFGGDLHALTEDARRRQEQAGRPLWRGKTPREADDSPIKNS